MSRIRIDLPSKFVFTTELPVRVSDLNYGGHVGNDSVLTLMQEARALFYRNLGFESEVNLGENIGQIISDAAVIYKSQSFLGDILIVQIAVADIGKYGFDMFYKITNKATHKDVAVGKTGIICFDFLNGKIASIPAPLLQKLV